MLFLAHIVSDSGADGNCLFEIFVAWLYYHSGGGVMKDLKVEVVEIISRCGARHKVGDYFYIRGEGMLEVPEGKKVCLYALNSLFPFLAAKQRQDELPQDDWIAETEILTCPDPKGVKFRITPLK